MSHTRTNEAWLHDLTSSGEVQENAIAELRNVLLRAVLYFFNRDSNGWSRDHLMEMAEDCAQEALISVMKHLSDFRGDSKFTTWAYKFGINVALVTARRERWKGISLEEITAEDDGMSSEWVMQDKSSAVAPDQSAMQQEVRETIREVIERDLTDKQRQVLLLMVFHDVPMDEVVRQMDTNRNAIYKLLHDARRKLKSSLQSRGFEVGETLALFGSQG